MPCPHNEISIVQRSHRQSAVAAAAYQSGEKLFCEYDQQVKHYPEKRGIVHNEILLPANAPRSYADRNTLWNAAEAVEKQWNSQLARRWVLTIPREIPPDQYAALVRDFCNQQFVSKGMCVDFAIHDKGDGNPHAHVMLTMRAMDERGKWLPKSRKVYELDKNGERIKLPSGRWKSHKEDTVDWNDRKYGEIWRHEWEVIQNRYLEANNRPERVDLRSYERQGLDIIPTVHEGAAVRQMEKRGIQTNIGNLNREIKAANSLMKSIRQLIKNLKGWIAELSEKRNELLAQKAAEEAVFLPNLLMKYMEIRKAERSSWTRAGQSRGTSKDLKAVSEALSYLQRKGLSTVEDLENFIETSGKSAADYRKQMKPKETRSNVIDAILAARTDCKECKPVYEKYQKIFFKKTKEKFKLEHPEVARFEKASAYLAKHPDDKDSTKKELLQEQAKLVDEIADLKVPLTEVQEDLKKLRDIRYWVRKATPGTEESKEPPKKQPLKEVLQGNNGLTKTKYLTFGIEAESMKQAKPRLIHIEIDLMNNFKRLGVRAKVLNGKERLHLMHDMFHMGDHDRFNFDWKWLPESGLSVKDFIAPTGFAFPKNRIFQMGGMYGSMSYLQITASDLSDQLLKDFLDMESSQIVTMHIQSVDQNKAIKSIKHTITELDRSKIEEQKKAVRSGYDMDIMRSW